VGAASSDLLKPFDPRQMCGFPVNTRINSVLNDDAECSRPVDQSTSGGASGTLITLSKISDVQCSSESASGWYRVAYTITDSG
jgi:hypothetical protein